MTLNIKRCSPWMDGVAESLSKYIDMAHWIAGAFGLIQYLRGNRRDFTSEAVRWTVGKLLCKLKTTSIIDCNAMKSTGNRL